MFKVELSSWQYWRSVNVWRLALFTFITYFWVKIFLVIYDVYSNFSMVIVIVNGFERDIYLPMDNSKLIMNISSDFLVPPAIHGPHLSYNLELPQLDHTTRTSAVIQRLLQDKRNGFFIECRALDGETNSNTLSLERFLNWSGLIIESDSQNFAIMKKKNCKAWLSFSCLSIFPYYILHFKQINFHKRGVDHSGFVQVQCFPLFSYPAALNISHVDYFSLDVGGDELDVLSTIPFDKVDITTLSVEFRHVREGKQALREFMESKKYSVVAKISRVRRASDFIFLKNSF